jgi:hypothetical protein
MREIVLYGTDMVQANPPSPSSLVVAEHSTATGKHLGPVFDLLKDM